MVAVAVCPHPPLLVPEVASGAAAELDELRAACAAAIAHLARSGARSITVVGSWPGAHRFGADALGPPTYPRSNPAGGDPPGVAGLIGEGFASGLDRVVASLGGFGVPLDIDLPQAVAIAPTPLPLSLTVAAWLLRDIGLPVVMAGVPGDLPPAECARWSAPPPAAEPWALLAMGDGSAQRGPKAPGFDDPRAEAFDALVADALAMADTEALHRLDPDLAAQLWCAGRAVWQVLAGLVAGQARWRGELLYSAAPYGVAYFVATWSPSASIMNCGS